MTRESADILDLVLALPLGERLEIVERILESVPPPGVMSDSDPEFAQELERRVARYRAGQSQAVPWEVARQRIRDRLNQVQSE